MSFTGTISDHSRGYQDGYDDAIAGFYTEHEGAASDAYLAGYDEGFDAGQEDFDADEFGDEVMS